MSINYYRQLAEGGIFNMPFLLHLQDIENETDLYLVNDSQDFTYDGTTYLASVFNYEPSEDDDSTLEIDVIENDSLIDMLEENTELSVESVSIFNGEEIEEIAPKSFSYGSATWDGETLTLKLYKDDRLEMTFPALIFNTYNSRGGS